MRKRAQRRQATTLATGCKGMMGWGWFFSNTNNDQDALEELRMTLYGGLINSETQPAFGRDILYEDASPRDTNGLQSGLKFDLQLNRAPVPGSEVHIDFVVTRTVSGDDYEVTYPVEPFASDTWLGLDPNQFGGSSAHNMMVMPIAVPTNGGGAIDTTGNNDNNIYVGRGHGQHINVSRLAAMEPLPRPDHPRAGSPAQRWHLAGGRHGNAAGQRDTAAAGDHRAS